MWPFTTSRFSSKPPEQEFRQIPSPHPHQAPITIRVFQAASAIGVVAGTTRAVLSGMEGDRVRATESGCVAVLSLSSLYLADRYSRLHTTEQQSQKLSDLNEAFKSREEDINDFQKELEESRERFATLVRDESASFRRQIAADEILRAQLFEAQRKEEETTRSLNKIRKLLSAQTEKYERQIAVWKDTQKQNQELIAKAQEYAASLEAKILELQKVLKAREDQIKEFRIEISRLQAMIEQIKQIQPPETTAEIKTRSAELSSRLSETRQSTEALNQSLKRLEQRLAPPKDPLNLANRRNS